MWGWQKNVVSNFPEFKEWSRFKGLVTVATVENEERTFMTLWFSFFPPKLRHSQKSLRALFQNAHVKSLGGRLPTEIHCANSYSLIFTSLGDFTAKENHFVDSRFPCVNNWRHLNLKGDNLLHRRFIIYYLSGYNISLLSLSLLADRLNLLPQPSRL